MLWNACAFLRLRDEADAVRAVVDQLDNLVSKLEQAIAAAPGL